jgi:diaminohydroxyphosphoribosylaminopyrimidine deaminase / 5-amino-6-(5-phosphoribosylamino)uracil reductase
MVDASPDAEFMDRALFLAERGRGTVSPNPPVGAVVVSQDGIVVGQGAHLRAGGPHAEVVALDTAGPRTQGASLYCTLEPCAHTGRTGPCVERIVPAGITRVVAAMTDPNPRVSGAGFSYLREHGIALSIGVSEDQARRLIAPFITWVTRGRPFVIAKVAVSADGFVGRPGERVRLTGAPADRFLHRQRAEIDAIAVGADTVIADDPFLTTRHVWRGRPLVRVLFDWRIRVTPEARVFSTLQDGPVIMAVGQEAADERPDAVHRLRLAGAEVVVFERRAVGPVLDFLAAREVNSLLVEGGPRLHDAFFDARLVDRVQSVRTRHVLGTGVPAAAGFDVIREPAGARHRMLGEDLLVEWDVHGID